MSSIRKLIGLVAGAGLVALVTAALVGCNDPNESGIVEREHITDDGKRYFCLKSVAGLWCERDWFYEPDDDGPVVVEP